MITETAGNSGKGVTVDERVEGFAMPISRTLEAENESNNGDTDETPSNVFSTTPASLVSFVRYL